MDVEHGDGRRRAIDALKAALDRRCSGYAGGTKSAQDILGVKRDDEAVLDEQAGPSRYDLIRWFCRLYEGGARKFDRCAAVLLRFGAVTRRYTAPRFYSPRVI